MREALEPPVIEPPECMTSPSSVTSRNACRPRRMISMPASRFSRDDSSSEQVFHNAAVLLVKLDQLAGHAHAARHGQRLPLLLAERAAR